MSPISNPLSERITRHYSELTKNNRRLADYLQLNPEKILMLSTNEIAEACEVSKASVSRFIRKLGYEDHVALRNELLNERDKGTPVITAPVEEKELQQELLSLEQLWAQLGEMDLTDLTEKLSSAKRIKIIGYRNSYPLALHFRQQLMQCRGNVELLPTPGQTIGEDIASITDEDFVIVIGIRRRVNHFSKILDLLAEHDTLLITDQSGQKYIPSVSHYLICHMNNQNPLDSYAAPMSLISYLVNKVYRHLGAEAVKVSGKVSAHYSQLDELE
ncbi:MurR/RpiR family transcriptional regulator [Vibrio breoganii]|uniref:MurR/RpiR family transcriptional regulator n=1 Tax=Vibrio breoganii TaxID=553239 RepID=UPI000C832715|nr:MurR/RpiR family transcriptional regulator [Vibrio breoganii]PMG41202.1 DNA-binding protein [Vibrio breoganii]PMG82651.1 DNA-binding protein [Vibrio breoganii]PMG88410.1 DNA-binding protein [Vibrio breoganii]PMG93164.1 DNA-binding protein [Vibrio breoganii]PMJ49699.1 DNA-binding protein [Vibrio breoganii]